MLANGPTIRRASDFMGYPLIHFDWFANDRTAPNWKRWVEKASVSDPRARQGCQIAVSFREELHAIEAVLAGQGIALCSDVIVGAVVRRSVESMESYPACQPHVNLSRCRSAQRDRLQVLHIIQSEYRASGSSQAYRKSLLWRSEMARGTVKWFNSQKGYGFIQPQGGGKDVFVHISAVERAGLSSLNEGQAIEYEEVANKGKTSAENLKVQR
jgi:cold shock protein